MTHKIFLNACLKNLIPFHSIYLQFIFFMRMQFIVLLLFIHYSSSKDFPLEFCTQSILIYNVATIKFHSFNDRRARHPPALQFLFQLDILIYKLVRTKTSLLL